MTGLDEPKAYRRLFWTFSPIWRRRYGELTLATLRELHDAAGRDRPTTAERAAFTVAGLRTRLPYDGRRRTDGAGGPKPSGRGPLSRALEEGSGSFSELGGFDVANVGPPLSIPLLRPEFLLMAGLGLREPVAVFPEEPPITDLDALVRLRHSSGLRLVVETVALALATVLFVTSPVVVLALGLALIATAGLSFDAILFIRLGRRILTEP